ncbi:hypothetical protein [Acinetobacter guillouiae]|uniref:hypothetical protein n=1 Tax=Acinetobacter guillouiae TaxID=106649 RepID=UPI003C701A9D
MKSNIPKHPCANKCTEFKGEQCKTCLVQQIEKREFELGVAPDDAYVKTDTSDFLVGDVVVIINHQATDLFTILKVKGDFLGDWVFMTNSKNVEWTSGTRFIRPATTAEIQANRRLTGAEQAIAEVS